MSVHVSVLSRQTHTASKLYFRHAGCAFKGFIVYTTKYKCTKMYIVVEIKHDGEKFVDSCHKRVRIAISLSYLIQKKN